MQRAAALMADRPADGPRVLKAIGEAGELEEARACLAVAEKATKRKAPEPVSAAPVATTFRQVAERWTSGALAREYPDHVRAKRTADDDDSRLARLYPAIQDVPIADFTIDHADAAMRAIPADLSSSSRRHYAQTIARVLGLAVFPLRLLKVSPLPRGWLPKVRSHKATAWLYPAEDAALLSCTELPLAHRVLYGFLSREGLRLGEASALRWGDIDLERGAVRLDANKTDDPRAWALDAGVTRALAIYRKTRGKPDAAQLVFHNFDEAHLALRFRAHLAAAGVERGELFERTAKRRPIRTHDLRATFVTLSLAAGKTEAWVADRTGHRSSVMINRYRRAARTAAELELGELTPLDRAIPELYESAIEPTGGPQGGPRGGPRTPADGPTIHEPARNMH